MRKKVAILVSLVLSPVLSPAVFAKEQAAADEIESIVVTATREPASINAIARSIDQISQSEIDLNNHSHVQEVLNQMPGVYFHRNSGQEYLAAVRSPVLTGAGACGEFLMLENGIPVRPAGMCNVNELFESHHQFAQSIEVLRGAATSVYGSNGLHGVVNIITPQLPDGSGKTALTLGSDDYYKLNQLNQFGNWSSALTIAKDGGFRDDSGFDHQLYTLKHQRETQNYDVSTWVTLFNLDQETAGYLVGTDSYKDDALVKTNANPEAYRKGSGFRLYQTYNWQSGLTVSPYLRHSKMEFMQHFLPGQAIEENSQTSLGVQSSNKLQLSEKLAIQYGGDAEYASISLLEYQDNETAGSAFLQATIPSGKHYDYEVDSLNFAAFAVMQYELSEHTAIDFGLRAEFTQFDYDNLMLSGRTDENGVECGFGGCRFSRPQDSEDDFFQVSPQLGVTHALSNHSQLFFSLIHGFRTPQATELYRLQREQTVTDLEPVELNGFDGGWRYRGDKVSMAVALYDYEKSNAIVRNSDFFNISGGKSEHRGLELTLEYALNERYSVKANSTFAKHTYLNNPGISDTDIVGLDIDTSPREMANLFLNYQDDKLNWQIHGQYVSDYFTDVENEHRYPGHFLTHLKATYQWSRAIELGARVTNLTDEDYAERADFSGFSGDRYFPGRGRSFNLSFAYNY